MPIRKLLTIALSVAAVTVALTACSSARSAPDASTSSNAVAATEKTPLSDFYSAIYGTDDSQDDLASQKKIQAGVVACMASQGFTYTATPPDDQPKNDVPDAERNTAEWVAANGYGLTETPAQEQAGIDAAKQTMDENAAQVAGLSPAEQEAYSIALYGPPMSVDDMNAMKSGDPDHPYDWRDFGCQGSAEHSVNGDDRINDSRYKPLMDALGGIQLKEQLDPRTVQLQGAWSNCMADAGYPGLKDKPDAIRLVTTASDEYYNSIPKDTVDATKLTSLRNTEIKIAAADFNCSAKVDYDALSLQVQNDVEKQFVSDHQSEIDSMMADFAQGN